MRRDARLEQPKDLSIAICSRCVPINRVSTTLSRKAATERKMDGGMNAMLRICEMSSRSS
ncbi:MAG: hypothetical protein U1F77_16870 [Kiritimatiellia bacterium]